MKKIQTIGIAILVAISLLVAIITTNYMYSSKNETVSAAEIAEIEAYNLSLEHDRMIESYVRVPSLDENFRDDEITIILDGEHSGTGVMNSSYDYNEVIEEFEKVDNLNLDSVEELFEIGPSETVSPTYRRMFNVQLEVPGKDKIIDAIEELQKSDMILSAGPKYNLGTVNTAVTTPPSDTYYNQQWGLNGTYGIDVETAWDLVDGSGIRVGILEHGIDSSHEDLAGRVAGGNFTPAAGTDLSHGTFVGGIISAVTNNNKGVSGVSQSTLYLLNRGDLVSSLNYAANNGIKIVNASFFYGEKRGGTTIYYSAIPEHAQAIRNYGRAGGLLVCASGNDNTNIDQTPMYPAAYGDSRLFPDINNVISVGSITSSGSRSNFSNYGENSVHIYAPGSSIISTYPASMCDNGTHANDASSRHIARGYHESQGTSYSAPYVTGTAALLLSYDQSLRLKTSF